VAGAYFGAQLGQFYDDTGRTLSKQASGYASLPTWVYAQLSPTELGALRSSPPFPSPHSPPHRRPFLPLPLPLPFLLPADAELRDQRLAEARRRFDQLAAIEEAEFKGRVQAGEVRGSITKLQ
jgi:hypothetical protein